MLQLRPAVLAVTLAACWTSAHPSDPPRWRTAPTAELLPDGAWFEAAIDVDIDSPAQRENEAKALKDPAAVHHDGGCTIPALHLAFAGYPGQQFAVAARGPMRRDAMIDCLTGMLGGSAERRVVGGRELIVVTKNGGTSDWLVTGGRDGLILGGTSALMRRALAPALRPASADSRLGPLIARARARGQLWGAALVPPDTATVRDLLGFAGVHLTGRIVSAIASVHVTPPYRLEVELVLERASDAATLAAALEARRAWARALVGPGLQPILDVIEVHATGTHVTVTSTPPKIDWLRALQDVLALVAELRAATGT